MIYGNFASLPIEFYGNFEVRYRYEVPIPDTFPVEYTTFYGGNEAFNPAGWTMPSGGGIGGAWSCDLVAGYKVTSNYVTLDTGTPI